MIMNAVVSGGEKEYTITDNTNAGYPSRAAAGAYLTSVWEYSTMDPYPTVTSEDGHSWGAWRDGTGKNAPCSFVMPSSNVTIT